MAKRIKKNALDICVQCISAMLKPSFTEFLISSAAMGGIGMFWFVVTRNALKKMMELYNEMFADKGAEEREIQEKVRRLE